MNKDQVTGKIDQAVGKVKQNVGEAVGNDELANKGVLDQVKGAVKETWGERERGGAGGKRVAQGSRRGKNRPDSRQR
jgi:uncharacterized protein YjbJ (UPF0337 family)